MFRILPSSLLLLLLLCLSRPVSAQTFPFTSGPIPPCDTSTFTATVSGVGILIIPDGWNWGPYLDNVLINITSNHPHTLQISLTSPAGTTLLLSAFNGAGGQNYTNTSFTDWAWTSITTGSAPFTGDFLPQGGQLSSFAGENADGTWTITVIDTACANGGTGPGGIWVPGWFTGGAGSGAFAFGYSSPPPPCEIDMGYPTTYLCPGETVDFISYYTSNWDQGQGVTFSYMDPNWNNVADPSAVSTPGWYTIQGWDWSGCNYYGSYEIVASPQIALGPDQVVDQCTGAGPVDLNSLFPLAGVTPVWSLDGSPITTATAATATAPGVYQLIGQNPGGCNDTALVTLNNTGGVLLGSDQSMSICPGSSADLTTLYSTAGATVAWYFGGAAFATPTAANTAGVYTLVATSSAGCTDTAEVTLTVQPLASLGADQALDLCSNTSLDLTSLYSTTGLSTDWTLNSQPVADPSAVSTAGTYQLVASNGTGCSDTAFVAVGLTAPPALGQDVTDGTCEGNTVDLTTNFNTTGLGTTWTLSGAAVPDPSSIDASGMYTLVATNATGCSDTAHVEVTIHPNPVLGADQSVTGCSGLAVDLTALYATGSNATSWTKNGAPVPDPTSATTNGLYTLTTTSPAGCTATASVTLTFIPAPVLGPDQAISICDGSLLDLTSLYNTGGLTGVWTQNGASVTYPTGVGLAGMYQVVVSNGSDCTDTALVTLTVNPNPSLGGDQYFSLCPWQTVDLSTVFPTAGMSTTYALNGQPVSDPTAVHDPGGYSVIVTDANGCTDGAMATVVNVECLCTADFWEDAKCIEDPVQFKLLADSTVLGVHWDFGGAAASTTQTDPVVRFSAEGNVLVKMQVTLSCGVVDVQRTIRMQDCSDSCNVWVPSSFTPDKDGVNDTWAWKGDCEPEEFSMQVFDRFGELIFETKDPYGAWDGTYRGVDSQPGVYAYRAKYRLPYQDEKKVMGTITLLK
ncbi:MAG: gliding motility-associated C-terminal domain-containing protein [Flavobacteriales bacterium]|nr:gliding motility-associated C-terminal domain-containing protein [Flavobacteriales bacterium]